MSRKCIIEKYLHKARFCGDRKIEVPYNDLTMMCHLALDSLHTSRWIPVSERLPTKEDGDVLAYYEDGTIWSANWSDVVKFSDPKFNNLIVDWMTLPNPPKEVE